MKKETYFGVDVSPLNYEEIIVDLQKRMERNEKSTIIAVNPEKVIKAEENEELKQLINSSTYQIPDGIGILLASKLKGGSISSRVTGVDMMDRLLQFAAQSGYKVFLYGAKEEVVVKAKQNIEAKYPNINISGYENGYVQDVNLVLDKINQAQADLLFVAMGSPKQELWIKENMNKTNVRVFQGVGGSFDVFAGQVKRAPLFFRKFGIEWLYRLLKEPKRLKRQLALPKFLMRVLFSK
ncbi:MULTISPECIES: WecB/TagA/CpsF family glycosyltransferase [Bacillaceae]|uniref:N-acetylglucosaminyldiphosphoundecaprenol N-acetyl-beta-D-mannosaminyltransferase n=1 Tax=Peribacillus huizhouensis TaxID=1501239 RepID=A0ABR6CTA4_9BACI|nr:MULTISPECIES: WecB/TagA/CpsF family glycosyltransferase [Bacillaceae]MBA9027825.1 N-acetylglucosaminyldiphosphoundecaprenol N-acetyl-beta-D-mannosaminyltransferase [Peribacillus huizhouensis]